MAIVNQQVAAELEYTGGQLPMYQPPVPAEVKSVTESSMTLLTWGLVAAVSLAGWFFYRKVK